MYFNEFELYDEIYDGNLSNIYRCIPKINKCDKIDYNFKKPIIFKKFCDEGQFNSSFEKDPIMISISYIIPGVRRIYGCIKNGIFISNKKKISGYGILMEYIPGINLRNYSHSFSMDIKQLISFVKQTLDILSKLHSMSVIHRDLKLDNIIITIKSDKKIKVTLIDFSLSIHAIISNQKTGTPLYSAPELINKKEYNNKIDMYSFGLILYEIIEKKHIYDYNNQNEKLSLKEHLYVLSKGFEKNLKKECISPIWKKNPILYDLLKKCLKVNPNERISSYEAYNMLLLYFI